MPTDTRPSRARKRYIPSRSRRTRHLAIESLEDRRVPAVYVVNSLADTLAPPVGQTTLRQAIEEANQSTGPGIFNTIELSVAGTYEITSVGGGATNNSAGEFAITGTDSYTLWVVNTSGGRAVIDGGGLNRVFDIDPSGAAVTNCNVLFYDLTITDGDANGNGGGIRTQGGVILTLDNVDVTDNDASGDGGGIFDQLGALVLNNTTFLDNEAQSGGAVASDDTTTIAGNYFQGNVAGEDGGALLLDGPNTYLGRSTFAQNLAEDGGAIDDDASNLMMYYSTLSQNRANGSSLTNAGGDGGGLYVPATTDVTVSVINTLFLDNAATFAGQGEGGAIAQLSGTLSVGNSELSGNVTDDLGGGVEFGGTTLDISGTTVDNSRDSNGLGGALCFQGTGSGSSGSTLMNDTFTLNTAFGGGGGICDEGSGSLAMTFNTINANVVASGSGGGIDQLGESNLMLQNSIIAQNSVGGSGGGPDFSGQVVDMGGNLVGNDSGSSGFMTGPLIGTASNPVNAGLGSLQDNGSLAPYTTYTLGGGPVAFYAGAPATIQVVPTEALLTTSPAFTAGVTTAIGFDARGFARPALSPAIGAYQPQYTATTPQAAIYIEYLYEVLFNRQVDSVGLAGLLGVFNSSGFNETLVLALENSTEYRSDQVKMDYGTYLDRPADPGGLAYWLGVLNGGATLGQVQALFLGSPEYYQDHGNNPVTVVESIYLNLNNNRPGTTTEVDGWARLIQTGDSTTAVSYLIIVSAEDETYLVDEDYQDYLDRAPAFSEVTYWLNLLVNSDDPQTFLISNILGSPEALMRRTLG